MRSALLLHLAVAFALGLLGPVSQALAARAKNAAPAQVECMVAAFRAVGADVWESDDQVLVRARDGKLYPITFSFDAELHEPEEYFRLIWKDPQALDEFHDLLAGRGHTYTVEEILKKLKISRKKFDSFVVQKGVSPQGRISITELNWKYAVELYKMTPELRRPNPMAVLPVIQGVFNRMGLPFETLLDGGNPELRHVRFELSPKAYRKLMDEKVYALFSYPDTHFHMGIPDIGPERTEDVARAMETRMVLMMTLNGAGFDPELPKLRFKSTHLRPDYPPGYVGKGFVQTTQGRWKDPHLTNDLELRQATSVDDAYDNLRIAMQLAQNHEKLRSVPIPEHGVEDGYTGNLPGALKYASEMLGGSTDPRRQAIARGLNQFYGRILLAKEVTPAIRVEIANYLKKRKVLDLLEADAFLKP